VTDHRGEELQTTIKGFIMNNGKEPVIVMIYSFPLMHGFKGDKTGVHFTMPESRNVEITPGKKVSFAWDFQETVRANGMLVQGRYHRYLRLAIQGYISRAGKQPVENIVTVQPVKLAQLRNGQFARLWAWQSLNAKDVASWVGAWLNWKRWCANSKLGWG
jgi:hypothetical protein